MGRPPGAGHASPEVTPPAFTEKDIEDFLAAGHLDLIEEGLELVDRQHSTDLGGRIDLLCTDGAGTYVVVELKRGFADGKAVGHPSAGSWSPTGSPRGSRARSRRPGATSSTSASTRNSSRRPA